MAKAIPVLICLLIVVIDVVAGILGIEAEAAQNKGKNLRFLFIECKEPVHQAYRLGLAAAILLGLAHTITILLGGCICICSTEEFRRSSRNKQLSAGTLILSWIILAVGFTMLIVGALSNSKSRVTCGIAHHNFLSTGGILCFVHGVLSAAYYVSASASRWEEDGMIRREAGV
ncbi:uncharacterized protein A4U43_C06F2390 [Asparagus officinalis]|uniref:Uncharacterized protein n=1 Tax=Asparagus officinalis TaxID=4686 RepID=A0A5P1EJH3_ASPOF|nr:uncharacterized protein LOC109845213 [Asparagus officinalis]ONK65924.1 uncharacterized protein A4U43_C06F2390 [Asparagus officinalis]